MSIPTYVRVTLLVPVDDDEANPGGWDWTALAETEHPVIVTGTSGPVPPDDPDLDGVLARLDPQLDGTGLSAEAREQLGITRTAPEPERDEHGHEWNGAFCSRCGADEASSFAAYPCTADTEEETP